MPTPNRGYPLVDMAPGVDGHNLGPHLRDFEMAVDADVDTVATGLFTYADPTASIGLAAVNGSALTAMRSDAAPALDQAMSPTWTQPHIFTTSINVPTLYGSSAANGDLTLEGTSHATKDTSYVVLQPTDGFVGIGTSAPEQLLVLAPNEPTATYLNWPTQTQLQITPDKNINAGAYIGSKKENHFYAFAGLRRLSTGLWEAMSANGCGGYSIGDAEHFWFCNPGWTLGQIDNPSDGIAMVLASSGYLGLGTLTPTTNFQVVQSTSGPGRVETAGSTTLLGTDTRFLSTFKVGDTITVSGETVRTINGIASDTSLTVSVAFSTTASNLTYTLVGGTHFSVLGNGRVGLGTTSPSDRFHISGAGVQRWRVTETGNSVHLIGVVGTANAFIGTGSSHFLNIGVNSAANMQILVSGNVGINAPNARKRLDIVDTTQAQLRLSYTDNSVYADFEVGSGGNLTIAPTGDLIFDPVGNDILPTTNYDLNLGSLSKKYLTLHAAELWVETLVAQDTLATIGGRVLIGPTTVLTSDLAAATTSIIVKHNQLANGDRVYLEANGKVEFMAITSAPSGTGPYTYTVTRNLDSSGANDWNAGDAVFNTGTTGDGFIDLYSFRGVKSSSQVGPTIVGNIRNSATYNDWTEAWAIGNLNGLYGYGVDTYGVGLGKFSSTTPHITIDATNGYRTFAGLSTVVQQIDNTGNLKMGTDVSAAATTRLFISNASQTYNSEAGFLAGDVLIGDNTSASNEGNIKITAAGQIAIRRGVTNYITLDATDAQFTNLIKMTGASAAISLGATPPTSATVGTGIWLDRTGMFGLLSNVQQAIFNAATGAITAAAGDVVLNSGGVTFASDTIVKDTNAVKWTDPADTTKAITRIMAVRGGDPFSAEAHFLSRPRNGESTTKGSSIRLATGPSETSTELVLAKYGSTHATLPSFGYARFEVNDGLLIDAEGSTNRPTAMLDVRGNVVATGGITSSSPTVGIGYAGGAGGLVTQLTSKATGVTLNKVCGFIAMHNAALAAGAKVSFVVTNSTVLSIDGPYVWVQGVGTANAYRANVTAVGAGSFTITVENITAGSLSEAPVIGFAIIRAANA